MYAERQLYAAMAINVTAILEAVSCDHDGTSSGDRRGGRENLKRGKLDERRLT